MALSELKDQIKGAPISQIVGNFIPLKKNGPANFLGLCPFHRDSRPSLNVNDDKNMFMCFACNTGGDAITFVEKFKNHDFIDALKEIATVLGLSFEQFLDEKHANPKLNMALKIVKKATTIYRKMALSRQFESFNQFVAARNLKPATLESHSIGVASKKNTLTDYLHHAIKDDKELALALQVALDIGLIKRDKNDQSQYYDTFRDRIIFPIWDHFGHPVGLTSRAVHDYQKAKYMNSLDSYIFNKRNILYGLHLAKSSIREMGSLILVEGNMDQIALYQSGFKNTVAIQGIGLSDYSLKALARLSKNIYLCLDADEAGIKAAEKINTQCLHLGILPKFIDLLPYKDPDELLVAKGPLLFKERFDRGVLFLDDQIKRAMPASIPSSSDDKLSILHRVFSIVAPLKENLKATERIGQMAKALELHSDLTQIHSAYKKYLVDQQQRPSFSPKNGASFPQGPYPPGKGGPAVVAASKNRAKLAPEEQGSKKKLSRLEKTILKEIVSHPQCLAHDKMSELLDFVANTEVKRYIFRLINLMFEIEESEFPALAMNELNIEGVSLEIKEVVGSVLFSFKPLNMEDKVIAKFLNDILIRVQESTLKNQKRTLKKKKLTCKTERELEFLMNDLISVERQLTSLKLNNNTNKHQNGVS